MDKKTLKDFMSPSDRAAMGSLPTWHYYCSQKSAKGVSRPGKTARDRAKKWGRLNG